MLAVSRQDSAPVLGCQQEAITLRLAAVSVLRYESSPGRCHLNHVIARRKSSSSARSQCPFDVRLIGWGAGMGRLETDAQARARRLEIGQHEHLALITH